MKILQGLPLQIMVLCNTMTSLFVEGNGSLLPVSIKKDTSPIVNFSEDKKMSLQNQLKSMILQHNSIGGLNRKLESGDWDFINEFFQDLVIEVPLNLTQDSAGIEFSVGTAICSGFGFDDIETQGDGNDKQYLISFLVKGLSLSCDVDYSYKGGFLVGSGDGFMNISLEPTSSIETGLIFESESFLISPPTNITLTCNPNIDVDVTLDNSLLDFLIGGLLPSIIESTIEPAICEAVNTLDEIIEEVLLTLEQELENILEPLPPQLLNPLYPEWALFNAKNGTLASSTLDYLPLAPFVGAAKGPLMNMLKGYMSVLFNKDGDIELPVMLPGLNGTDLLSVKMTGVDNFDINNLSSLSTYTIGSSFVYPKLGLEIELGVTNEDNSTDVIFIGVELEDLVFDFALMLVIEQSLDLNDYLSGFQGIGECISNSLYAFEIASMSLQSGTYKGVTVDGAVDAGPLQLVTELSDAFTTMFRSTLFDVTYLIFELFFRGGLNEGIAMSFSTCTESLAAKGTVYVPAFDACWKIELFEGGTLSADYSDPDCSSDTFNGSPSLSIFEDVTASVASFTPGTLGWQGTIEFKEDPSTPAVTVVPSINGKEKVFSLVIIYPTCKEPCSK